MQLISNMTGPLCRVWLCRQPFHKIEQSLRYTPGARGVRCPRLRQHGEPIIRAHDPHSVWVGSERWTSWLRRRQFRQEILELLSYLEQFLLQVWQGQVIDERGTD